MRKHRLREGTRSGEASPAERSTDAAPAGDFEDTASMLAEGEPRETAVLGERFTYLDELGRGGMGAVYQAVDRVLERRLAVKVLDVRKRDRLLRHFRQEAQITSQLDHPAIPPIHDYGLDDRGRPYMMMKLVSGESLQAAVDGAGADRLRPERLERFLRILTKVCEAVSFAHSRSVVHRDIKPANIMVGDFGQVYLMDWGLAHRLPRDRGGEPSGNPAGKPKTFGLAGTVSFMAPEQAGGRLDTVDERTDVFQLGATLYYILAGRPPYLGEVLEDLLAKVTQGDFPAPEELAGIQIPPGLSRIALRAMARDPGDRYPSAHGFQKELEVFLRGSWHLPTRRFARGQCIVREGEPGNSAYIIVEGRCEVFRGSGDERVVLREMGPGEAFGETAVVSEKPRTASVEALEDVVLMVVTREALTEGLGISSWVGSFVTGLAERFRDLSDRLQELERKPPEGSVLG